MNEKEFEAWKKTDQFKDYSRIRHIAIYVESLVHRLDSFDEIDTDWFYRHPETGCVEKPSLAYRVATTHRNIWDFLTQIGELTDQLQPEFDGSRELAVCLNALYQDVLDSHDYVFDAINDPGDDWECAKGYSKGIQKVKRIFERAQSTFRTTLLLLATRTSRAAGKISGDRNGDDELVTIADVAVTINLSRRTVEGYAREWPEPIEPKRGRRPAKWLYLAQLRETLKRQTGRDNLPTVPKLSGGQLAT